MSKYTQEIKAYALREEERKKTEAELARKRYVILNQKAMQMLPAVEELIDVANECIDNHIDINAFCLEIGGASSEYKLGLRKNTDMGERRARGAISELDFFYDCGNRGMVFRNDGLTFYSQWGSFSGERERPSEEALQIFVNNFNDFERKFYNHLEGILRSNE